MNYYRDYATITLTDRRGHILMQFVKEKGDSGWIISGKPGSRKSLKHKTHQRDLRPQELLRLPDGRLRLNVPGPLIRWELLPPILDRLFAKFGNMRLTVDELHFCTKNM